MHQFKKPNEDALIKQGSEWHKISSARGDRFSAYLPAAFTARPTKVQTGYEVTAISFTNVVFITCREEAIVVTVDKYGHFYPRVAEDRVCAYGDTMGAVASTQRMTSEVATGATVCLILGRFCELHALMRTERLARCLALSVGSMLSGSMVEGTRPDSKVWDDFVLW
ncbi:hypothetical protein GUJ93_ZPchr0014g47194 [Zizania palustris]|uniref:Uncharacterized protein n=1 Tax=Zizania palustris TaxID=103762 RepID=A0A8J5SY39_ZIZPA|nr:hypothetical protein GUJ93_ZPchr0014g47194 [Zizania palustris]